MFVILHNIPNSPHSSFQKGFSKIVYEQNELDMFDAISSTVNKLYRIDSQSSRRDISMAQWSAKGPISSLCPSYDLIQKNVVVST